MKKIITIGLALVTMLTFLGCPTPDNPSPGKSDPNQSSSNKDTSATPTIFLAGDSTVKTYADGQWIAGWGQYLGNFLNSSVKVSNCAQGGRSTRSFINEGRLFDTKETGYNYNFNENEGRSIEEDIKKGDFLFIQFGHNDDDTKAYNTMYNRMVPLGTPDANGIYPVTPGTKSPTTYLPEAFTSAYPGDVNNALAEIAKYGENYYAYDCGGTYKWFLKQYIDFARSKEAIPVLVTPVARVSFNADGTLKSGPGLHGEDFAYVKAVRQLAEEENCLLIDLFDCTKTLIETATQNYADFLMAIVPNDLNGEWPSAYDDTYGDTSKGFQKIEATHYNKYGAFLTTAMLVEKIMANTSVCKNNEYFNFTDHILSAPSVKIAPSTLISKSKVQELNDLIKKLDIVNTDVVYANPADVVALIDAIIAKGEVTAENHLEIKALCEEARDAYLKVNVDDRSQVTNYAKLEEYEEAVEDMIDALRPKPVKTVIIDFEDLTVGTEYTETVAFENYSLVATSDKSLKVYSKQSTFTHNGESYSKSVAISTGGSATFNTKRVIAFATEGKCRVTVAAQSTSASADRLLGLHSSDNVEVATFDANGSLSVTTADIDAAGTYYLGSKGSGIYISTVIIEYFE